MQVQTCTNEIILGDSVQRQSLIDSVWLWKATMADGGTRYAIDYSKRASKCKRCSKPIDKGLLRIAKLGKSTKVE